MDDRDVRIVEEYMEECVPLPSIDDKEYIFDLHAYTRWAVEEILDRVIKEAMKLPEHITGSRTRTLIEIIDEFIDEMDYYVSISNYDLPTYIFSVARDEGFCLRLYICSRKELDYDETQY